MREHSRTTSPGRAAGTARVSAARRILLAGGLLLLAAGGVWGFTRQAATKPPGSSPGAAVAEAAQPERACCASPGPANMGRVEEAGPESAPVDVLGCQGTCMEHKVTGDMLMQLASEYPGLVRVRLWPMGMNCGPIRDPECAAYLLRAKDYTSPDAVGSWEGYEVLCEKSPALGGWEILELEDAVRAAIVASGGEPTDARITPEVGAAPSPPAFGSGA